MRAYKTPSFKRITSYQHFCCQSACIVETGPTAPVAAAPAEGRLGVVAGFAGKPLSDLSDVERDKPELGKDILPGPARPAPPNRGERGGNAGGIPLKLEGVFGLLGTANPSGFD